MNMADDTTGHTSADDDWGAALAEQAKAAAAAAGAAASFQDFAGGAHKGETQNDIDFILDIPVQLTVELGRTKIAIKNLLQLAQGSVVELVGLVGVLLVVLVFGCLFALGEVVVVF